MGLNILGDVTRDAHWQPEPAQRGTSSILQTCLITLCLCVYSSIHLNVPPPRSTGLWKGFLRKARWLLTALLAPELVVYTAFAQRKDAVTLLGELRKTVWSGSRQEPWYHTAVNSFRRMVRCTSATCSRSTSTQAYITQLLPHISCYFSDPSGFPSGDHVHLLTEGQFSRVSNYEVVDGEKPETSEEHGLAQAFFICMGGLVTELSEDDRALWPPEITRMTLTPELVICIAETYPEVIPKISIETVSDRSKASNLVKTIACTQALWFCLQFITRLAQRLPITLLELNTFVHTICAILIYLLWWEKPLDARDPICLLSGQSTRMRQICAWASTRSKLYQYKQSDAASYPAEHLIFNVEGTQNKVGGVLTHVDIFRKHQLSRFKSEDQPPHHIESFPLLKELQDRLPGCISWYDPWGPYARLEKDTPIPGTPYRVLVRRCEVGESGLQRLRLASELDITVPDFFRSPIAPSIPDISWKSMSTFTWIKRRRKSNYGTIVNPAVNRYALLALLASGVFYGGLHLLVLGSELRDRTETLLWEISCIAIMAGPPACLLIDFMFMMLEGLDFHGSEFVSDLFLGPALLFYGLCRVYIVVEVFLLLPHAGPRVFEQPNWSLYFPHIG